MPAFKEFSLRVFLLFVVAMLGACSGGDGTLFSGTDGSGGVSTKVGDVQVSFSPITGSDTDVLLVIQVVDQDSVLLPGATVRFVRDNWPAGVQIATDSNITDSGGLVTAVLSFPSGYSDELSLVLEVQGTGDKQPFTATVSVRPGLINAAPDVDNLVVEVSPVSGSTNELLVTVTALGALNQPLSDAVIFVRLGSSAPAGVSVIVSNPVTNDSGIVTARVIVPEGLTQLIPLLVSVDGQSDASASVSLTVLPPGVEGVVGGLQVLTSTENVTAANEIELVARVVGQQNQLLSGVRVFFDLVEPSPVGSFIRVTDDIADGDEGARAILTFPDGATNAIDVLVSVQTGDTANPVISRVVSVALTTEDAPFVSQIQLTAEYDAANLADNEVLVRALALGRFNELVDGATIFFQLGAGAAPGASLRVPVQDPVTSGTGGITAIITFPEGFSGAIPVIASVVGPTDQVPVPASINVLSPFARSPVGGLQLVYERIGTSAEVKVTARVVDTASALLSGVPVRFSLGAGAPASSFIRVTQPETLGDTGAVAIVTFPSVDFTGTISVVAQVDTGNLSTPTLSRAIDVSLGIEDDTPFVSDIELEVRQNPDNAQAVNIFARVVDQGRGLVDDVIVSFGFGTITPAGAQLYATQPVTSGSDGAIATLVFPDGYTSSILIVATASGRNNSVATASIAVPSPIVVSEPEPDVSSLRLVASSNTLDSDADLISEGVTLTAIATDASNNLLTGATILFTTCELSSANVCITSADKGGAGALLVDRAKTDATGTAQATLTTSGNVRNRKIRVTASSRKNPAITATFDITVTGTNLTLIGPTQLASNSSAAYTATLRNSGGFVVSGELINFVQGAANIDPGNQTALLAACASGTVLASVETGANGSAQYTVTSPTSDFTLVACTLQNSQASGVNVAVANTGLAVDYATPLATDPDISFDICRELTLTFTAVAPTSISGQTLSVGITRGQVFDDACITPATTVLTDAAGVASAWIKSSGPNGSGLATFDASHSSGATDSLTVEFVAIAPTRVDVSAEPATVPANGTSTIRAVVRDADNNLVKNQTVSFNLLDPSGGTLNAANQITDSQGRAEVTYTASGTTSARDAVTVTAAVDGTALSDAVNLTVGGDALRISLGTGNSILEPNQTTYQLPYAVIVTDSLGNPAPPETQFRLSVRVLNYAKGIHVFGNPNPVWAPVYSTTPACRNEDIDLDGVLDTLLAEDINNDGFDNNPGAPLCAERPTAVPCDDDYFDDGTEQQSEDFNENGLLTPGNIVSVPTTIALEADGTAQFNLTYAQQYAYWVQVELRAIASVSGTEAIETQTFYLPGAASDFSDEKVNPPGNPSPFGTGTNCNDTL